MLNSIISGLNSYTNELPDNIDSSALTSGLYTFSIAAILSGNLHASLFSATLAATVSVISSLSIPIFKKSLIDTSGYIRWYDQAVHSVAVLGISQLFISSVMSNCFTPIAYQVNFCAGAIFTVGLNLLLNGFKDRSSSHSAPYILIADIL